MKSTLTSAAGALRGLLLPALLLLAWEWASGRGARAAYVFVPLEQLGEGLRLLLADGTLALHVGASLERALTGMVCGAMAGIATGTLMAQSRVAERLIGPLFHSIRQVPLLGLVPLIALWAGSGEFAKLLIIGIAAFYPTVLNTFEGMRGVDLRYREVGAMLTMTRGQLFRHVLLPAALPSMVTGLTHAQVFAWLACLGGELLFAAAPGIGSLLQTSEQAGRMDVVLLSVLVIALLAQSLNLVFTRAARLLVRGRSSLSGVPPAVLPLQNGVELRRFLVGFIGLTLLSGMTIGMNKVLATMFGLQLGVSNFQLALISTAESCAMALGTLPAGRILARGNPKTLYAGVSLTLSALFCILPWLPGWQWVALLMFVVGLCIALRVVAMSTVFLVRLPQLGQGKSGWYKGTLTFGMQFAGPLAGNYVIAHLGLHAGFLVSALMFAILALLGWQVLPTHAGHQGGGTRGASSWTELLRLPAVRTTYLFEVLASFTASSVGVFSILLAIQVLHWPHEHAVWLMAVQGLGFVIVLLGLGKPVLGSPYRDRYYGAAHLAIMAALVLLGLLPTTASYLGASILLGLGLGVNALVNTDRIAHAPVDKARVSAHLTLFGMGAGTVGALAAGRLGDLIGLRRVFLLWLLPWLAAWLFHHLRAGAPAAAQGETIS